MTQQHMHIVQKYGFCDMGKPVRK